MADVYPFRGLRFNPATTTLERVVTQPYDKISKEMQERYYALDPCNFVRVVLGKAEAGDSADNNVYTRAARQLQEWRESGVIVPLKVPAFAIYFQRFTIPGTREERLRKGFVGLGRLEDYENRVVFPHERTLAGPKQDRLQLLRHTRTHFEQIFMLYEDPELRIDRVLDDVAAGKPDMEVVDEYGVTHTLWIVDDPAALKLIQEGMSGRKLIIADGHHRYETALAYRNEMRATSGLDPNGPHERLPMTFFNMNSPALTILPTHRVLAGLAGFDSRTFLDRAAESFDVTPAPQESEAFRAALTAAGAQRVTVGACLDGGNRNLLLGLREQGARPLDVAVLHSRIIEGCLGVTEDAIRHESHITYVREFDAALGAVKQGRAQVAFLLNATRLDQLRDIAYGGSVMPQKSTDFYPKVLSGLLLYSLDGEVRL